MKNLIKIILFTITLAACGGGGGGAGGNFNMNPDQRIAPAPEISGANNDGTITWTVRFVAGVNLDAIDISQFTTSDDAMLTISQRTRDTITLTSTHTTAGDKTLTYTGTLAMMQTSQAVMITMPSSTPGPMQPPPPPPMPPPSVPSVPMFVGIENFPNSLQGSSQIASIRPGLGSILNRNPQPSFSLSNNQVTYDGTTYNFPNTNGISEGGTAAIINVADIEPSDNNYENARLALLWVLDNKNATISNRNPSQSGTAILENIAFLQTSTNHTPMANLPNGNVQYEGSVLLFTVGTGSGEAANLTYNSSTTTGTFNIFVDFAGNGFKNLATVRAEDGAFIATIFNLHFTDANGERFLNSRGRPDPSRISNTFAGNYLSTGDDDIDIDISGGFYGPMGKEISAIGNGTFRTRGLAVVGLIGKETEQTTGPVRPPRPTGPTSGGPTIRP